MPGAGVCPVTTGVMGREAEIPAGLAELLAAEVTEAVLNPDVVTRLVASARVIPVRSGMA